MNSLVTMSSMVPKGNPWTCTLCTYVNLNSARHCQICRGEGKPKQRLEKKYQGKRERKEERKKGRKKERKEERKKERKKTNERTNESMD